MGAPGGIARQHGRGRVAFLQVLDDRLGLAQHHLAIDQTGHRAHRHDGPVGLRAIAARRFTVGVGEPLVAQHHAHLRAVRAERIAVQDHGARRAPITAGPGYPTSD